MTGVAGRALGAAIRGYQLTLSGLMGRTCRHLPSCSDYALEAMARHGAWAGSWISLARVCRCGPGGTAGLDFVCEKLPEGATWRTPWRYGRWRGTNERPSAWSQPPVTETSMSRSSPLSTLNSRE